MTDATRCFIALDLSEDLKNRLTHLRQRPLAKRPEIRWIRPANLHITLKFLGDQKLKTVDQVIDILHQLKMPEKKIIIHLDQIGVFPDAKRPRIIWVGFEDNALLLNIYDQIETQLATIGIPKEKRPFAPHITIARVKAPLDVDTLRSIEKNSRIETMEEPISQLTFYKSTLTSQGSLYEPLTIIHLNG